MDIKHINAQTPTIVAGAGLNALTLNERETLASIGPIGQRIIHSKVTRHMAGKYKLNMWAQEFLSALGLYLIMHNRVDIGVAHDPFVDWTGSKPNWKKRMAQGGRECLALGCISRHKFRNGHVIDITHKGRQLLNAYEVKFIEILKNFHARCMASEADTPLRRQNLRLRKAA